MAAAVVAETEAAAGAGVGVAVWATGASRFAPFLECFALMSARMVKNSASGASTARDDRVSANFSTEGWIPEQEFRGGACFCALVS